MLPLLACLAVFQAADSRGYLETARVAAAAGDWTRANALLERATAAAPTWGLAWLELAEVQLHTGADPQSIERSLTNARSLEPRNPRAWLLTGRLHEQRGAVDEAIAAYGRAVRLRETLLEARERAGVLLLSAGRAEEALAHLRAAAEARPGDRALRANLAEAYERTGDLKRAEAELKALANGDSGSVYRRRLAYFYSRTGRESRAEAELKKAEAGRRPGRNLRQLPASAR